MRVCLISTAHDALDDRLYYKEACSLAKEHEVTVFAPLLRQGGKWKNEHISFVRMSSACGKVARLIAALRVPFWLRNKPFDIIHVVDYELLPLLPIIRYWCRMRVVYDVWEANYEVILESQAVPAPISRILAPLFRCLEKNLSRHCDLVLTADCAIAKAFEGTKNLVVIKNYPLLSAMTVREESFSQVRDEMSGRRCVIYQGAMREERGVLASVLAMDIVRKRHPDVRLLLVGQMPKGLGLAVQQAIVSRKLKDHVKCIDWVGHNEVGNYLAISEVGLVPFKDTKKFRKNIPQKIFEYWAFGLPVIATDLPPIRYFVDRCGGGVLLKESTPESLAKGICDLLGNPVQAKLMGERGRVKVNQEWRWDVMEKLLLAAYRKMEIASEV